MKLLTLPRMPPKAETIMTECVSEERAREMLCELSLLSQCKLAKDPCLNASKRSALVQSLIEHWHDLHIR
jgi:hypothetical protein